ncbi:MAG: ExbD/TolR family protein, partial [Vicinamibacterales bacterium]
PMSDLRRKLEEALEEKSVKLLYIKADEDAPYGAVMEAMDEARAAGIEDMGLITEKKNTGEGK